MAKLTLKSRAKIPTREFAGKGRTYPVEDKKHAKAAIGLSAMHHAPNRKAIVAKAEKVLGKGGKKGQVMNNTLEDTGAIQAFELLDRMESGLGAQPSFDAKEAILASIAISLKRIADYLETQTTETLR